VELMFTAIYNKLAELILAKTSPKIFFVMISSKTQILFARMGDNFGVPLMNSPNVVLWCWMFDGHYTWMV
jgi:hypothetical protein